MILGKKQRERREEVGRSKTHWHETNLTIEKLVAVFLYHSHVFWWCSSSYIFRFLLVSLTTLSFGNFSCVFFTLLFSITLLHLAKEIDISQSERREVTKSTLLAKLIIGRESVVIRRLLSAFRMELARTFTLVFSSQSVCCVRSRFDVHCVWFELLLSLFLSLTLNTVNSSVYERIFGYNDDCSSYSWVLSFWVLQLYRFLFVFIVAFRYKPPSNVLTLSLSLSNITRSFLLSCLLLFFCMFHSLELVVVCIFFFFLCCLHTLNTIYNYAVCTYKECLPFSCIEQLFDALFCTYRKQKTHWQNYVRRVKTIFLEVVPEGFYLIVSHKRAKGFGQKNTHSKPIELRRRQREREWKRRERQATYTHINAHRETMVTKTVANITKTQNQNAKRKGNRW